MLFSTCNRSIGIVAATLILGCSTRVREFSAGAEGGGGDASSSSSADASSSSADASSSSGGDVGGSGGSGGNGGNGGGGPTAPRAALPLPPGPDRFMWQGSQTEFLDQAGEPCQGLIAIAVGDRAVCYGGPGGVLRCAGSIYTSVFGPQFTDVPGAPRVAQILISPTVNSEDGNGLCVRTPGGEVRCMGNYNSWGQFGDGTTQAAAGFASWATAARAAGIATGTWDQLCALTTGGEALCTGYDFDTTPEPVGSAARSVAIDTFGKALLDAPDVFRVENGRAECRVGPGGFDCRTHSVGQPGAVVDGTHSGRAARTCWLTPAGEVSCAVINDRDPSATPQILAPIFTQGTVLAIAGNYYTDALCAVYADGSISCVGNNDHGQLGVPDARLVTEKIVQPPGSVDVSCR